MSEETFEQEYKKVVKCAAPELVNELAETILEAREAVQKALGNDPILYQLTVDPYRKKLWSVVGNTAEMDNQEKAQAILNATAQAGAVVKATQSSEFEMTLYTAAAADILTGLMKEAGIA